jgi:hypothetical protein
MAVLHRVFDDPAEAGESAMMDDEAEDPLTLAPWRSPTRTKGGASMDDL